MPTQLIHDRKAGTAWLEYYGPNSSAPERTPLESFPFTIGRVDSADLTVDSNRVSREHAEITQQRNRYMIRDLGSTNGTFLNGKRIEESRLTDGDVLKFADVEFSFYGGDSQSKATATLRMSQPEGDDDDQDVAPDLIRDVRRLHETLVHRAIDVHFQPIGRLDKDAIVGCEAALPAGDAPLADPLLSGDFHLVSRLRALARLVAVEQAARFDREMKLFVTVDAADVGAAATNSWLTRLSAILGGNHRLVVQIPHSAVCDIPYFREFLSLLRDARIGVAYDDIAAGAAQLLQNRQIIPDYFKLAPSLARGISRNRNLRRNLREIVDAADELECDLIVAGVDGNECANVCRDLGCNLAQGEYIGAAQPADQLADVSNEKRR